MNTKTLHADNNFADTRKNIVILIQITLQMKKYAQSLIATVQILIKIDAVFPVLQKIILQWIGTT